MTKYFAETFGNPEDNGNPAPFCTNCEFLQWGAWGTRTDFADRNSDGATSTLDVHLGWWVAGDITTAAQLADPDNFLALGPTATYNGHTIGNVANNIDGSGWKTYVAAGDMNMKWSFADRSGDLTISKFDTSVTPEGLTFSGRMAAPGSPMATISAGHCWASFQAIWM